MRVTTPRNPGALLLILMLVLGLGACKSSSDASKKYAPNQFTLLLATSNDGEVGPCG